MCLHFGLVDTAIAKSAGSIRLFDFLIHDFTNSDFSILMFRSNDFGIIVDKYR
jgi:hypothetical protein